MAKGPGVKADFSVTPSGASECVVVFHEVWGLVSHTQDVCKRIGKLGFAAWAPNLYKEHDAILRPDNIQQAMEVVWDLSLEERRDKTKVAQALDKKKAGPLVRETVGILYDPTFRDKLLADAVSAAEEAGSRFERVSTLGFCIGGGLSLKAATKTRKLTSAVSFYGEPPTGEMVRSLGIPVLAIFASQDEIINQKVPDFVKASLDGGKDITLKTYPRTKHGFFNDTRKEVYDEGSAADSWGLLRWFLGKTLGEH